MTSTFDLSGRVCVLTGATGGIGRALGSALVAQGCRLILSGRNPLRLEEMSAGLPPGSTVAVCAGSLTDPETAARLLHAAVEHKASVLINLAGINQLASFAAADIEYIRALVDTNLILPMQITRQMLPALMRQPAAMVVNIGSVFGAIGHPGYVAYSASKFGLRGFSEALGRELADTPVRVVHVAPRATRTAMNDGGARRLNEALGNREDPPEVVASAIVRAMLRCKSSTTLGWPERAFVVFNQLFPRLVDKAINANLSTIKAALLPSVTSERSP